MRSRRATVAALALVVVAGLAARGGLGLRRALAVAAPLAPEAGPSLRSTTPDGLALWIVDDSTKVFPGDLLASPRAIASGSATVVLEGARGETVAFQAVLAAPKDVGSVEVASTELSGPAGRIAPERVEVLIESYVHCPAVDKKVVALGAGDYPDALLPLAPFGLSAHRNQPLWVDVAIPREAKAGAYQGHLRVTATGLGAIDVRVALTVHPFEIPKTPTLTAWVPVYEGRLLKREALAALDSPATREVLERYYRMAHDHRFVTQVMEQQPSLDWDVKTGALRKADWRGYDALNGGALDGSLFEDHEAPPLWKVGGFIGWGAAPGETPSFGGNWKRDADLTPAHRRALGEYAQEIARHFKERGWSRPRLFMYMIDEPDLGEHPALASLVKAYGDAIHASGTGIGHLVTMGPQRSPIPRGAVDIWAEWGAGYLPREMAARQALGERAWFYQQHEPYVGGNCVNDEGLGLRSWGWIAWRHKVDGVFLWVGNFWNQDPYSDPKSWNENLLGNGVLFYPGAMLPSVGHPAARGPVSSFRMKALRRGLLDYEYLHLLRSAGGDPDALVARVVHSALNEGGWDPYWRHPRWAGHGDWSHDAADWDAARREAAREILRRTAR